LAIALSWEPGSTSQISLDDFTIFEAEGVGGSSNATTAGPGETAFIAWQRMQPLGATRLKDLRRVCWEPAFVTAALLLLLVRSLNLGVHSYSCLCPRDRHLIANDIEYDFVAGPRLRSFYGTILHVVKSGGLLTAIDAHSHAGPVLDILRFHVGRQPEALTPVLTSLEHLHVGTVTLRRGLVAADETAGLPV
jgi:hypothetical protein